jgi:hypothetical protein
VIYPILLVGHQIKYNTGYLVGVEFVPLYTNNNLGYKY